MKASCLLAVVLRTCRDYSSLVLSQVSFSHVGSLLHLTEVLKYVTRFVLSEQLLCRLSCEAVVK